MLGESAIDFKGAEILIRRDESEFIVKQEY
jgi:hypothetical protein